MRKWVRESAPEYFVLVGCTKMVRESALEFFVLVGCAKTGHRVRARIFCGLSRYTTKQKLS